MQDYIEVKSNGKITAKKGTNPRTPYNHQKDAMAKLNLIDQEEGLSSKVCNLFYFFIGGCHSHRFLLCHRQLMRNLRSRCFMYLQ